MKGYRFKLGGDCRIASTAIISDSVVLGSRVLIGAGAILHEKVVIGDGCFIGPHVILGEPTRAYYQNPTQYESEPTTVGPRSIIRANTCIYAGVRIGGEFECGPFVNIREGTVIGSRCRIGSYCDIQGECTIGDGCRFHSSVHITQFSTIGNFVWMFPYVLTLNAPIAPIPPDMQLLGPTIGDYSVILSRSLLMARVRLGKHVVIGANSRVMKDFGDWVMAAGDPAKEICDSRKFICSYDGKLYRPFPWMRHRLEEYPSHEQIPPEWELHS